MRNAFLLLFSILFSVAVNGQEVSEQYPIFPACAKVNPSQLENCFYEQVYLHIYESLQVAEGVEAQRVVGEV